MSISYNSSQRVFRLDTPRTTYLIGLVDEPAMVGHVYYGPSVPDDNMGYIMRLGPLPSVSPRDKVGFCDRFPFEYPAGGRGFREPCLGLRDSLGGAVCELFFESYSITPGKPGLPGLPATFGSVDECDTLEIVCRDPVLDIRVRLLYTAFRDVDVIARSAVIENTSAAPVTLTSAMSASLEIDLPDPDVITLHGSWARERTVDRRRMSHGVQSVGSVQGKTGHEYDPGIVICEHTATQTQGLCYGETLVYSGNFLSRVEMDEQGGVRVSLGINPAGFTWLLEPGESFTTPEALLVCSNEGLGGMSRTFHDVMRRHLIRGQAKHRPSLVNSWESFYFDFDTEKLLELGREASRQGIELLVMDDGWFGHRNDDNTSLGDWYVNESKLPGGLSRLADELEKMNVKLGIWMEPEMISQDSDLYRAHPDYAMTVPGREPALARNQLVLDLTRPEVRDHVYGQIKSTLSSAKISYLKWDMNRSLSDVYSPSLPPERQGEAAHRYMLGVYELQERLVNDFPDLLLENCSGGGARFDPGMLYYSPQIWTSDNAEAEDRLVIQEGAALFYPLSAMGAHVAACPSHVNGRVTPFETRGRLSLPGAFGYELDLSKLTGEEKSLIPRQLEEYRTLGPVFHDGDYYRLASLRETRTHDAYMCVSKDKSVAVINYVQVRARTNLRPLRLTLFGLDPVALYRDRDTGDVRSGAGWMNGGVLVGSPYGDMRSFLTVLVRV